ncbi:MAG: hypothetical protein PHR44_07720 [Candidatus Omnitrophica bacterium]|nr:hypothetical protein [Candidatus Omnitrophota bacterium]
MVPSEALELALSKEIEAMEFYERLGVEHPVIKDICVFLSNEEYRHKELLEKKIREMEK